MLLAPTTSDAIRADAELVQATLGGNRDAFQEIVLRYQSLICSLAYSATGSFTRSEDLAQETFVTAWQRLGELRDPSSLRAWLCGIARNLIHNSFRRGQREPAEVAGALDGSPELAAGEASPTDEAIRAEEEAILWRALGRISSLYREPLILYYRQHRSVAEVAAQLDLTEDTVKQRLSRGRALLQQEVAAFIEGTLARTNPNTAFTSGVMSALPGLGAAIAAASATSTKVSAAGKAATSAGGAGFFAAVAAAFAGLAAYVGWQMSDAAQSREERVSADRFWRSVVIGLAVIIAPTLLISRFADPSAAWARTLLTWWLGCVYILTALPFALWAWYHHRRRRVRRRAESPDWKLGVAWVLLLIAGVAGLVMYGFPSGHWTDVWLEIAFVLLAVPIAGHAWAWWERRTAAHDGVSNNSSAADRHSLTWVGLATLGMAGVLVVCVLDYGGWQSKDVTTSAARDIIAAHRDADVSVLEYQNGHRTLGVRVPAANGAKQTVYFARFDAAMVQSLEQRGVRVRVLRQGEDFEVLGQPGRLLLVFAFMVLIAGLVVLARGWRERRRVA